MVSLSRLVGFLEPEERASIYEISRVLSLYGLTLDDLSDKAKVFGALPETLFEWLDDVLDRIDFDRWQKAIQDTDLFLMFETEPGSDRPEA